VFVVTDACLVGIALSSKNGSKRCFLISRPVGWAVKLIALTQNN